MKVCIKTRSPSTSLPSITVKWPIDHDMDAQYQVKCNLYIPWFWKVKTKILHIRSASVKGRTYGRRDGRKTNDFSGKFVQFRIKNYR